MLPSLPRVTGTVDFFDRHTGRGQVIGPDHRAYWLHRKELSGISELRTGQPVEFTPTETPRGPRALEVRPCGGDALTVCEFKR